jgi:hypothetical protein
MKGEHYHYRICFMLENEKNQIMMCTLWTSSRNKAKRIDALKLIAKVNNKVKVTKILSFKDSECDCEGEDEKY